MVRITDELDLSQDVLTLYHTTDGHLGNSPVLVFHGPSIISNSTLNSSRIQVHIFTIAGFQSYGRITISPNSPFYQSVDYLPREKQGDEICRGLAFGLLKYLKELPDIVKSTLKSQITTPRGKQSFSVPSLFSEQHAAVLAGSMIKAENTVEVVHDILTALCPHNINHVDIDLILPSNSIKPVDENSEIIDDTLDSDVNRYGEYAPLVKLFGNLTFIPSSKLRRAPSRASSINRSRSFSKEQKISLRREMGELVDTEERYVIKMYELVHNIANEFLEKAKNRTPGSFSPSEEDLENLFPKSLYKILQVNSAFLDAVQKIMDESEENAMLDLEAPAVPSTSSRNGINKQTQDPTGALAFAKSLLEWFPQFSDCYQDYIRASQLFPQIITSFAKQQSSFSKRVQVTGEQHLRSAVIEPVQRLPRYSLFIDNIVSCLPVFHPALQPFLKARDIVTTICSMDPSGSENSQLLKRLENLIDLWPTDIIIQGRLITAVDYIELASPFHKAPESNCRKGIFLVFADKILLLNKSQRCSLSAKGFLAEIEKPSASSIMANMTATASGNKRTYELYFSSWYRLSDTRFTTSDDSRVYMISANEPIENTKHRDKNVPNFPIRGFILQSAYENKGKKFTEEMTKARIEGRFSEEDRESCQWSLRSVELASTDLTLHTAIYEETADYLTKNRTGPATLRVFVDRMTSTNGTNSSHQSCEVNASIKTITSGSKYRFEITGKNQKDFAEELVADQLLPTVVLKIIELLRSQYSLRDLVTTGPYTSFYTKILKSLQIQDERDKNRSFMPSSPVKLLTNLFNTNPSISGNRNPKTPSRINFLSLTRSDSNKSKITIMEPDARADIQSNSYEQPDNHLIRLEETFSAYITAIHSRKGNVVGRALRYYSTTDELAVNAIYNTFIENPYDQRTASEVTIDILFAAFEKYLRMAWKEQMGDVISLQTLDELQLQALRLASGDFSHYVKLILSEMTPQNRRAFISIVKLLADLLDGCGNDGDRGAITAAFAELLVIEGNPHDYINLLDRLVLDQEKLFQFSETSAINGAGTGALIASISGSKSNSSAMGSIASNTSSFRKRFAETVLRQNTSNEKPSVWRSLGKNSRNITCSDQTHINTSLYRSRSIESQCRRPNPRERPTVMDAFEPRPSSSSGPTARLHLNGNSHSDVKAHAKPSKKKRRSSLSDLKSHQGEVSLDTSSKFPDTIEDHEASPEVFSTTLSTLSPSKIPLASVNSDRSRHSIYKTGSPTQKENMNLSLPAHKKKTCLVEHSPMTTSIPTPPTSDVVFIKDLWTTPSLKKPLSLSKTNIPPLSSQLPVTCIKKASRPPTSHSNTPRSPQKLRLSSPQKLRERIHNEAKAIQDAEADIHSELSKISSQMARLHTADKSSSNQQASQPISMITIQSSLSSLATKIPDIIADLTARNEAIGTDLERSLHALEFKVRGLDQLYLEATTENELLYERFNGELARIVKAVKGKVEDGVGSLSMRNERLERVGLVDKIRESTEENAIIRSENARLKRELLSLKALLKLCE